MQGGVLQAGGAGSPEPWCWPECALPHEVKIHPAVGATMYCHLVPASVLRYASHVHGILWVPSIIRPCRRFQLVHNAATTALRSQALQDIRVIYAAASMQLIGGPGKFCGPTAYSPAHSSLNVPVRTHRVSVPDVAARAAQVAAGAVLMDSVTDAAVKAL